MLLYQSPFGTHMDRIQQKKEHQKFPYGDKDTGDKDDRSDKKLAMFIEIKYPVTYRIVFIGRNRVCFHDRKQVGRYEKTQGCD